MYLCDKNRHYNRPILLLQLADSTHDSMGVGISLRDRSLTTGGGGATKWENRVSETICTTLKTV